MLADLPVEATILFASGEDTGFTSSTAGNSGTSGTTYRTGYARGNIQIQNGTTVADPPGNRATTPTFTAGSTLWIHGQFYTNTATTTSGEQALIIRSPDGVSRLLLRQTGTTGTLKASKRNSAGTITDLATASGTYSAGTITQLDVQVIYGCTSSDQFNVWLNSTSFIAYTGASICTDAATQLNQADYGSVGNGTASVLCSTGATATVTCWSEMIIADQDTRGMALWTLNPSAAGNTQSWTPNTLANVNKAVINDATSIAAAGNNSLSEWTTPTSAPSGSWGVLAIVQEARIERGTTGPQNFEWLVRTIDGSDNVTGSVNPTTAFVNYSNIWATNPHTSASWVIGDIASGFNLGIESLP